MELQYKEVQSCIRPKEIDSTSSPNGVYLRKNITQEDDIYTYKEAFLSLEEYNQYIISKDITNEILDKEDSEAFQNYEKKLNTGVLYTNGHLYKPKYINDYKKIMDDVITALDLLIKAGGEQAAAQILAKKFTVYDETGLAKNAELMTVTEIITLYFYLYTVKEQYYQEYKAEKQK